MPPPDAEEEGSSMEIDTPEESSEGTAAAAKKKNDNITPSASGAEASKYPDMQLAQSIHRLTMVTGLDAALDAEGAKAAGIPSDLSETVMKQVGGEEVENPSLYRHLVSTLGWEGQAGCLSDADLTAMEGRHKTKMEELEKKVEDAKENAGDMEVLDARFEVARFAAKSLSKDEALEAYDKVFALPKLSSGKKIDCLMESARVALFHGDNKKTAETVDKAAKLAEAGGDWDRRNRLKVYSALSKLLVRDVKGAASLLIDCIATFSCTELCSYTEFVVYTIISNILYIPRTDLKSKIIDGPEILSVASDIPVVVSSVVLLCRKFILFMCFVVGYQTSVCVGKYFAHALPSICTICFTSSCPPKSGTSCEHPLRLRLQGIPPRHGRPPAHPRGRPLPPAPQRLHHARAACSGIQAVPRLVQVRHPRVHGGIVRSWHGLPRPAAQPLHRRRPPHGQD